MYILESLWFLCISFTARILSCSYNHLIFINCSGIFFIIKWLCFCIVCMCIVQYDDHLLTLLTPSDTRLLDCICCFVNCCLSQKNRKNVHCLCIMMCMILSDDELTVLLTHSGNKGQIQLPQVFVHIVFLHGYFLVGHCFHIYVESVY